MQKIANYFIIAADHHYLQVKQAIVDYNIATDDFYIVFIQVSDRKWIDNIIELDNLKNYSVFQNWIFKDLLFNRNKANSFIKFLKQIGFVKNLFVSQYTSDYSLLAYNIIEFNQIILMDEGTASYRIVNERVKNQVLDIKRVFKSIVYGISLQFPKHIEFYTQYDLEISHDDSLRMYEFERKSIQFEKKDENSIVLLGSSMVEVNLISEDDYLYILSKIKNIYKDCSVDYYAHRKENMEKLERISLLKFNVIKNSAPFETVYPGLNILPKSICSFYSPVLINLSKMYIQLPELIIYQFDLNLLRFNKEVITDIYEAYKSYDQITVHQV